MGEKVTKKSFLCGSLKNIEFHKRAMTCKLPASTREAWEQSFFPLLFFFCSLRNLLNIDSDNFIYTNIFDETIFGHYYLECVCFCSIFISNFTAKDINLSKAPFFHNFTIKASRLQRLLITIKPAREREWVRATKLRWWYKFI